jgi:hypothetical protein
MNPKGSAMNVDAVKRHVIITKDEIRDHQNYLKVKALTDKGYGLTITDPVRRPGNSLVFTREEGRTVQAYEAAKARAEEAGKDLWVERPEEERRRLRYIELSASLEDAMQRVHEAEDETAKHTSATQSLRAAIHAAEETAAQGDANLHAGFTRALTAAKAELASSSL